MDLADGSSWWQGPQFSQRDSSIWPPKIVGEPCDSTVEERKSAPVEARVFVTNEIPELLPRKFSDWTRLVMTRAWVHRFIVNSRNKERTGGELTSDEIEAAGHSIIREAQQEAFHDDIKIIRSGQSLPPKSRLAKLSPRIDSSGMIRSDGRTQLAEWLPFDKRFAIILPRKHPVTGLIVKDHHEHRRHGGTNETLAAAVHIEMAYALDASSFLNALSRMISRRGRPLEIVSDNGGNFVSTDKQLRDITAELGQPKVRKSLAIQNISWTFNPPLAPRFGGVHEVMIRAAKRALYAILTNAAITDEELVTALAGAEFLINSRPLTYQSASPSDDTPLTPNHFLHGRGDGELIPATDRDAGHPWKQRWRHVQMLIDFFGVAGSRNGFQL